MSLLTDIEFADKFTDLVVDHREWSERTFGSDKERGPLGALRHLEKEAREAQAEAEKCTLLREGWSMERLREELADCLLLILDASRRAGVKPMQLVEAAQRKMAVNRSRSWPTPSPFDDLPIEHVR